MNSGERRRPRSNLNNNWVPGPSGTWLDAGGGEEEKASETRESEAKGMQLEDGSDGSDSGIVMGDRAGEWSLMGLLDFDKRRFFL